MKVEKNGVKKTGKQNLLCKTCRLQFKVEYKNKDADTTRKEKMVKILRSGDVRDCSSVLDVSLACVLCTILQQGATLDIKPKHRYYKKVQIDDLQGV